MVTLPSRWSGRVGQGLRAQYAKTAGPHKLFCLRDLGTLKLPGQLKRALDGSIEDESVRWGFEHYSVEGTLSLAPAGGGRFPVNVDGSTMPCRGAASFRIVDRARLMARSPL